MNFSFNDIKDAIMNRSDKISRGDNSDDNYQFRNWFQTLIHKYKEEIDKTDKNIQTMKKEDSKLQTSSLIATLVTFFLIFILTYYVLKYDLINNLTKSEK